MSIKTRLNRLEESRSAQGLLVVPMKPGESEHDAIMLHTDGEGAQGRFVVCLVSYAKADDKE